MLIRSLTVSMCAFGLMALSAGGAHGQSFPNKPIRILTSEPGGGLDFAARLIAQGLTSSLNQQVIVENRGGAGGAIAIENVAKALPDGYTLLTYGSAIWLMPFIRKNVSYDPVRDFAPITLAVSQPNIVVVHPALPANSIRELIALAKAKPGELNYGAGGAATHVKSGRLKALAVTSAQPSALFPNLPTVEASGVPGYEAVAITGMFAPAKTPVPIINRLNQEIVRFLRTAHVKERLFNSAVETVGSSPEQLASTMKSEMARLGKVIRDAGIREE